MSILCYHAVQPGWTAPMSVEPSTFAAHARWLAEHRTVLPLDVALRRLTPGWRLPRREVALTFDDGLATVLAHAAPELRRWRLPATVFLVARTLTAEHVAVDWVDRPPDTPLRTLDAAEVAQLQDDGVEFQSHSYAHADLTTLSYEDCVADLRRSREVLEDLLRRPVTVLAYPRGRHNADVRAAAARAGYEHALALPEVAEEPGPYAVPRVGVYHDNGLLALRVKTRPAYLPLRLRARTAAARRAQRPGRTSRAL